MGFVKHFRFTIGNGLEMINVEDRETYLLEKVKYFSEFENYGNKNELLDLLGEIAIMIEHDIATASFIFFEVDKMGGFNLQEKKEHMVYYYDLCIILGTIFFNVFDRKGNRIKSVEEGTILPFSTREMFANAYNEFLIAKQQNIKNIYGATLIFTTLLEHDLKLRTKMIYTEKLLNELDKKISSRLVSLSEADEDLYLNLRYNNGLDSEYHATKAYDNITASGPLAYQLFEKYDVITTDKKFYMGLFGERFFTLNNLLISQKFKDIIDLRFWEIIDIMFNPSKMNLRNNLAHCNINYENYYNISMTALIYGIYMMVSTDMFLK